MADSKGRKTEVKPDTELDDMDDEDDDMDDGAEDEDSAGYDDVRKALGTDAAVTDEETLGLIVYEAVQKALPTALARLAADIEKANRRIVRVYKALGAVADQNEELEEKFETLRKALGDVEETHKLLKGLSTTLAGVGSPTPATRKPQAGTTEDAEKVGLLQKGAGVPAPGSNATLSGALTQDEQAEGARLMAQARQLRDRHQRPVDGLLEAAEAANVGALNKGHIARLRKGIESFAGLKEIAA